MTYMIKISQTGEPKLVKVPEKPNPDLEKYVGDSMLWDEDWEEYKQALASALADESKHFKFKDIKPALMAICENKREKLAQYMVSLGQLDPFFAPFVVSPGQSFPLPTGWRVEFEEVMGSHVKINESTSGAVTHTVAILLPEQPEESQKHDCTDYAKINCTCPKGICRYHDRRSKVEQPEEKKDIDLYVYETRKDSLKHTGARFIAIAESISCHCCFMYTIVDTMAGFENPDEEHKRWKRIMCECFYLEETKELLSILNY